MTTRRGLWLLILVSTAFRLVCAGSVGAYANEAYYGAYARNLSWGYFDHPPMVGLVSAFGLALFDGIAPVFGLRLGFVLLAAGSTWLLARLTERLFGARAGLLAALAFNATIFYGLRVAVFAEPDGPLVFFWLLTLDRLWVACEGTQGSSTIDWLLVGAAWGWAMLTKYYAVLLPCGAVAYLILRPECRRILRQPGPYLGIALGMLEFAPVIVWNSRHNWVSFLYQGSRAGGFEGIRPSMLLEALVGQALYLTPWIWLILVAIMIRLAYRGPLRWSKQEAFLACQALPVLGLFMSVATFRRIMPQWPMIGFATLLPLLGRLWSLRFAENSPRMVRRLAATALVPVVLAGLFIVQARTGLFQDGRGRILGLLKPEADPTVDTIRWDQVAGELKRRGILDEPDCFLFTSYWKFSAELEMATHHVKPVACYHRDSRSYTFWSRPEDWVGRNAYFVGVDDILSKGSDYTPWFERVEPLPPIPIVRGGVTLQTVKLFRCFHQTDPFLFGYNGPGPMPRPRHDGRAPASAVDVGQRPSEHPVR